MAREALGITEPGTTFDTVLEGRNSYELGLKAGASDAFPHLRHVVFSTTLVPDPDSSVEIVGGRTIAATLADEIDRPVLRVAPLTIGAGIGLLGRDATFSPQAWRLADRTELPRGALFLTYDRT